MSDEELTKLDDEALREAYKKSDSSSSETRRFQIAEELENRGMVVPIPADDGEVASPPTPAAQPSAAEKLKSATATATATKPTEKKEDKSSKKASKADKKKDGAKEEKKKIYAIVGVDRQQIVHNIIDRTCRTIGLKYIRAQEINDARKTLSSGAAIAAIFEYDQSDPDLALDHCKLANTHSVPPVLMGRFFKTDVLMAMRAGVADIIKKPMDQEFLKLKLQKLLQKTGQGSLINGESIIDKIDFAGRTTPDEKAAVLVKKAKEILALPHAVTETIRICNAPDSDMKELQMPISSDPALSSMILRRSNSAASGSNRKITNILDAVVRIGRKEVKTLALTLSVFNMFSREECTFGFNRQMYWVHAISCGIAAKAIAQYVKDINPEDAFLAGLLHDIGKIIFDDYLNKEYQQVIGQAGSKNLRVGQVELEVFAMDHSMLGARVAENWKLPETVVGAIRSHHKVDTLFNPEAWGEEGRPIISQIVCLSNSVVKAMRLGHSGDFFADDMPLSAWTDIFPKTIPASKIVSTVLSELNEYAQFLKINLRAAFVDVNVERKEGVALVGKTGIGPLLRFFFENYGYATQMVPLEKLVPGEGIAYLAMDARSLPEEDVQKLLSLEGITSQKMIMLLDSAPDALPAYARAPIPARDFLQVQRAIES